MNRETLIALALAYLAGSIPFAYIAGRLLRGIDIRQHGSGNAGTTNVFRVLGPGPGIVVGILDLSKGWLAAWLSGPVTGEVGPAMALACGLAAVAGHAWPAWLGFRGGKGVLTAAGAFLFIAWLPLVCSLAVFAAVFAVTRYVSLGSLSAAALLPVFISVIPGKWDNKTVVVSGIIISVVIFVLHRSNIRRLFRGEEHGFGKRRGRGGRGKNG